MKKSWSLAMLILALAPLVVWAAPAVNKTVEIPSFTDLLSDIVKNPKSLITFIIQFLLGLGLGYYSLKAIKHIAALIAIFVIGGILNVWSLGGQKGIDWNQLYTLLKPLIAAFSIRLTLPILLGLLVGLIIASR